MKYINWIDLETTGLDVEHDEILEVAFIATDGLYNPLMIGSTGVMHEVSAIVGKDENRLRMTDWAWRQHQELAHLCFNKPAGDLAHVDAIVAAAIESAGTVGAHLGGSSPHFDRAFIERYMPRTNEVLGYRNHDVSTLLSYADTRGIPIHDDTEAPHRALEDLRRSIRRARIFDKAVRGEVK